MNSMKMFTFWFLKQVLLLTWNNFVKLHKVVVNKTSLFDVITISMRNPSYNYEICKTISDINAQTSTITSYEEFVLPDSSACIFNKVKQYFRGSFSNISTIQFCHFYLQTNVLLPTQYKIIIKTWFYLEFSVNRRNMGMQTTIWPNTLIVNSRIFFYFTMQVQHN